MTIREMSREECLRVLASTRFARLACARENQPYIVPVSLTYHESADDQPCLYGFTTPGQKIEWMRANPLVCVEVDSVTSHDQWISVIVFGRYEELPETPGHDDARLRAQERPRRVGETQDEPPEHTDERSRAYQLLKTEATWWETGYVAWVARGGREPDQPYLPVYYKVRIDEVTGRESTRDPREAIAAPRAASRSEKRGWLRRALARAFRGTAR